MSPNYKYNPHRKKQLGPFGSLSSTKAVSKNKRLTKGGKMESRKKWLIHYLRKIGMM